MSHAVVTVSPEAGDTLTARIAERKKGRHPEGSASAEDTHVVTPSPPRFSVAF